MNYIKLFEQYNKKQLETVILYHGSKSKFDEFDDDKISTGSGGDLFGKGYYFTDNIEIAQYYGKDAAKRDFIKDYKDGILGSYEPVFSDDADEKAQKMVNVNIFKISGYILDHSTFIIDDDFKEYIIKSYIKHSRYSEKSARQIADTIFDALKNSKHLINKFRGELEYVIIQLGDKIIPDMVDYIKKLGYDGIKYTSNTDVEKITGSNYIIFNKKVIHKIK